MFIVGNVGIVMVAVVVMAVLRVAVVILSNF